MDDLDQVEDRSHLLQLSFYIQLLKRRILFFLLPCIAILIGGAAIAYLWPPTYLSEGKILVQTQLIPSELVKSTVTTLANERIQVIQQRVMTRDNLLAIVSKFDLFPQQRDLMSVTELVELMRKSTTILPVQTTQPVARGESPTIAFTVGFYYRDPVQATRVANEFLTRILNEDLRDRTNRATDTTKFLTREVDRLRAAAAAIDTKITNYKASSNDPEQGNTQLSQLKSDLVQKSLIYSDNSPVVQSLKRQIDALEKSVVRPSDANTNQQSLESLQAQQESVQKDLEIASQKLSAAKLGESLERDQQAEKLEVIEQPTEPQTPVKPNRLKILALAFVAAIGGGVGIAFLSETFDRSIRRAGDLFSVVDSQSVASIPYIETLTDVVRAKRRRIRALIFGVVFVLLAAAVLYFVMPPLDLIIAKARVGLFR